MTIREATKDDLARLRELYEDFFREQPAPPDMPVDLQHELNQLVDYIDADDHVALLAEDDGGAAIGFALAKMDDHPGHGFLSDLYVAPGSRRQGAARRLIREVAARLQGGGAVVIFLDVGLNNAPARATYERLGFKADSLELYAPVDQLLVRASREPRGESFGSAHVQTDDVDAVEKAVRKYIPRFGSSGGSAVAGPRNGWTAVYDELCDREPSVLRRLGSELSNATDAVTVTIGVEEGAVVRYVLFERGSVVDEYLSVPDYYGALPPGDAIALGANATVVGRLTSADSRAFKEVARTAGGPDELPPSPELVGQIAGLMGLTGATHGYEGAGEAGARVIAHR
jgi:ribosomal protein S18 acetylase RimI-like enzyme